MPATLTNDRFLGDTATHANDPFRTNRRRIEGGMVPINASVSVRPATSGSEGILRHGTWDALFITLALAHGALLCLAPSVPLIAIGFWWNTNTISHNFIHVPFFQSRVWNAVFSACLSLLLGLPQRLWRDRHLAHHAEKPWRWRWSKQLAFETVLVLGLWTALATLAPKFLSTIYLPGFLIGLGLCQLQGYFEHEHGTTSHYGWLYNLLFFNDGYHVEHHARPSEFWGNLPKRTTLAARASRWPAVLRWLEHCNLDGLEQLVLRSKFLQQFVLAKHERAFRALLPKLMNVRRVVIVGGGLFPRTALILQRLLPEVELTIIEAKLENLRTARRYLNANVQLLHEFFDGVHQPDADLLVVPLAFVGDRATIYRRPPTPAVLVHDWLWRRRGVGVVVSLPLLKRLNLVTR